LSLVLLSACASTVAEVKDDDLVGQAVTVKGEVKLSLKIGSISGFMLKDETGQIAVRSDTLPADGATVTVKGILIRDSLLGYYIQADKVN